MGKLVSKLRRGLSKPPNVIMARLGSVLRSQVERIRLPYRAAMPEKKLLRELDANSLEDLWKRIAARRFAGWFGPCVAQEIDFFCGAEESSTLLAAADLAVAHCVDLLGSGKFELGKKIDWHTDFKTGFSWPCRHFTDIDYNNPDRPSDVKVPWELSRLQWLMPAGQAYLLTGDERYAIAVRDVLEQWIESNRCGASVNWSCTMEAALRVFSWTWFFHVFHKAPSWQDPLFQFKFLRALFLHVEFTDRHIEWSDVNGNHYTADAAALVIGGLFFGDGQGPKRWGEQGWDILCKEILIQVYPDGVDFEASVAYHRLVTELFLWPAMNRVALGQKVDSFYLERLRSMGRFSRAYTRPDGGVPLWGDADDARALPFGTQDINDHRYLHTLIGLFLGDTSLCHDYPAAVGEVLWVHSPEAVRRWFDMLPDPPESQVYADGGFYIMRTERDHVFIDCGPVGLAGRGGHGHNDCLSFEAMLDGVPLVSDCGAYLYTASFEERNFFRSTTSHNTPQVDGEEINRFIGTEYLWNLHNDASPRAIEWRNDVKRVSFCGEHTGYIRLISGAVIPRRTWILDKEKHSLAITDLITGSGEHHIEIPLHLSPGVKVRKMNANHAILEKNGRRFRMDWYGSQGWQVSVEAARVSPSYGKILQTSRFVWRAQSVLPLELNVKFSPSMMALDPEDAH